MLLQSKILVIKQKLAKDWLQSRNMLIKNFFIQSDSASNKSRNIKYINDIFNRGKYISFAWVYNRDQMR